MTWTAGSWTPSRRGWSWSSSAPPTTPPGGWWTEHCSRAASPALSDGLAALGLEVVPGQANYLLFRAAGAADLNDRILTRGVLIRSCANYHGLGNDWYRVCVGQADPHRRLLAALKEVL